MTNPNPGRGLSIVRADPGWWSLRTRVVLAIVAVALAPQVLVFALSQLDRYVPGRMSRRARDAALKALPLAQRDELPREELDHLARESKTRLRVLAQDDLPLFEADFDNPSRPLDGIDEFFVGPSDAPSLREFDAELGPMSARPEVLLARKQGWYLACEYATIVFCQAIASVPRGDALKSPRLLVVQTSSRRDVLAVYELRHRLVRLSFLTLPLAVLLAFYTGWRVVRPIERLRRQVLEKTRAATARPVLDPERRDEVGVLADAFNAMLLALEAKRVENEAFVADLVHELKNPVAAVRAAAETLSSGTADAERRERIARALQDSSGKLDRVVTQFLELARAEAGLPNEERTMVDVAALVEGLVRGMRGDEVLPGVRLDFDGADASGTPARVHGVAHRLEALFRELLENARSFAGNGGRVQAIVGAQGDELVVVVTDTGPGIAPEDLGRVFSRFFTTRGRTRGTGLGLALVAAVAHAHGGRVAARSNPGEGAIFEVRLPRAP